MWASKVFSGRTLAVVLALVVFSTGCASSRMSNTEIDRDFMHGEWDSALERLKQGYESESKGDGKDALLYLLDMGLAHHYAGRPEEAIRAFQDADRVAEIKDYTSIAAEAATLLTSDNIKHYKGEEFENVLISVYLAISYAEMGKFEDAVVEARRVNHKLEMMVSKGGRKYQQNAFARYLSGALYEAEGEWNSAYIDYKKTLQLEPGFTAVGRDLYRVARILRMSDEAEDWAAKFHFSKEEQNEAKKVPAAEIIVIFENGISPEKVPNPAFYSIPIFRPRYNPVRSASVSVDGVEKGSTQMLHDVEAIAIQNLEEKYAGIIAKKVAGVVAKEAVAAGIGSATNSRELQGLTRLILYLSDQADLRSWKLLPRDFQIARIPVDPGLHQVKIVPEGYPESALQKTVQVGKGKKVFVSLRYWPYSSN